MDMLAFIFGAGCMYWYLNPKGAKEKISSLENKIKQWERGNARS